MISFLVGSIAGKHRSLSDGSPFGTVDALDAAVDPCEPRRYTNESSGRVSKASSA